MKNRSDSALKCWLIGIALCTFVWVAIFLWGDLRYLTNDDVGILRAFMGYQNGKAPTFHLFLHGVLTWPLYWLSTAFPGTPWFSIMQIALLWLAGVVTVKSLLQNALHHRRPLWMGVAASLVYLAVYCVAYWTHVNFTFTAALLGAAAVAQIFSIDYARVSDKKVVASLGLSLLLVVLAYALRQVTALPILAFCALSLLIEGGFWFGKGKRSLRPLILTTLLVAVVMGGLMVQRQWDIRRSNSKEYLAWQEATERVMDYTTMDHVSDETLKKLGWSRAEYELVSSWYFLDENITTEAFNVIYQEELPYIDQSLQGKAEKVGSTLALLSAAEPVAVRSFYLSALLAVTGFALLGFKKKERRVPGLGLLFATLLCAAMLVYLALQGRLPARAALMAVLPATVIYLMLLPSCAPEKPSTGARLTALLCGLCCAGMATAYLLSTLPACLKPAYDPELEAERSLSADLDEYALNNPDYLIIYDYTLMMDTRMFPDVSEGIPQNVMFWGGWTMRSPENLEQMAAFGLDGLHFTPEDFLRENVCLASGVLDPPAKNMLDYLNARLEEPVDVNYEGNLGNVHVFMFYPSEE